MPGHERDHGSVLAMCERHSGVRGDSEWGGHSRHFFKRTAGVGKRCGFLSASPEDERIAALEPHYGQSPPRAVDQHPADLLLRVSMRGLLLADIQALGRRWGQIEQRIVG